MEKYIRRKRSKRKSKWMKMWKERRRKKEEEEEEEE